MHPDTGWSPGQRALLRFLEQQGVLTEEPAAPAAGGRPTNADLFAAFASAIDQQALVDLVSQALRIGTADLAAFTPMADLAALVPAEVARRGEVVPLSQHDGTLEVAAANPLDLDTVKTIEFTTGLRVRTRIAKRADVCRVIGDTYGDGQTGGPAPAVDAEPAGAPAAPGPSTPDDEPSTAQDEGPAADDVACAPVEATEEEERVAAAALDGVTWSFEGGEDRAEWESSQSSESGIAGDPEPDLAADLDAGWQVPQGEPDGPDGEPVSVAVEDLPAEGPAAGEGEPVGSLVDEPADLRWFDDVRLEDPELEPDVAREEAPGVELCAPAEPEPELQVVPVPLPDAATDDARPAVVVVSRDLTRRVALRAAIERDPGAPCVLGMRDELEARAALALGGIGVVVVDGDAIASDGRLLWQALKAGGARLLVRGGAVSDAAVETLDLDAEPEQVAARVRELLGGGNA